MKRRRIHKNISPWAAHGRRISRVYEADKFWKAHSCRTTTPTQRKLFNFDLTFGGRTLLVLDNYGAHDGGIPIDISRHVFNGGSFGNDDEGETLAIDKATGVVHAIGFGVERGQVIAFTWPLSPDGERQFKLPRRTIRKLDELKKCKRPFRLLLDMGALCSFIIKETGYEDLRKAVTLSFDFRPLALEISQESYRFVGDWT